jgi:hypothetical protein
MEIGLKALLDVTGKDVKILTVQIGLRYVMQ